MVVHSQKMRIAFLENLYREPFFNKSVTQCDKRLVCINIPTWHKSSKTNPFQLKNSWHFFRSRCKMYENMSF